MDVTLKYCSHVQLVLRILFQKAQRSVPLLWYISNLLEFYRVNIYRLLLNLKVIFKNAAHDLNDTAIYYSG